MSSAWMAGAWFDVMPRTHWSFYLLSVANAAIGLGGVWMLAGLLLRQRERTAALIFLMLTPAYTVWALKFNANSVLLSSWPWTTYFFLVSLQKRSMVFGALAGLAGGIALLSKYYSIVLIATLFVVAVLHPDRRRYFGSAVPYLTIAVGLVVVAPHIWWLVDADFSPLRYAFSKTEYPEARARAYALWAVIEGYSLLGLGVIAFAVAFGRQSWPLLQRSLRATILPDTAWLVWLAHGPLILTVVAYLASNVRITGSYLMPVFFALPVTFLAC